MLLSGNEEVLLTLREQYGRVVIISEEDTGVGFFIHYQVDSVIRIGEKFKNNFQIGDIDGKIDGIDEAIGFILFIKYEYLTMLKGYTNSVDKWSEMDTEIKLCYNADQRDYESLRKAWTKAKSDVNSV